MKMRVLSYLSLGIWASKRHQSVCLSICLRLSRLLAGPALGVSPPDASSPLSHGPGPLCPPRAGCWGHSLELVDDDHAHVLSGLQDLLQPVDVVRVGIPERDVVGQARDLDGVWAVPDQFVRDQHRPVQAQGLAYKTRWVSARGGGPL